MSSTTAATKNIELKSLVDDIQGLVSLPEVAIKISSMVDDPNVSVDEIGKLISQDPALTIRVLAIANSPFYGLSSEVSTIARAVTVLGTKQLTDVVLSTAATSAFAGIPIHVISVDDFWHHSLYCGLLAQELSNKHNPPLRDSMFVAGLLHDIGHLVMFNKIPELIHDALLRTVQGESLPLYMEEREVIGFDHAQVGAALAREWHLPAYLIECIEYHHEPEKAKNYKLEATLIHIANAVAALPYSDDIDESDLQSIDESCWQVSGLKPVDVQQATEVAQEKISEMQSAYF